MLIIKIAYLTLAILLLIYLNNLMFQKSKLKFYSLFFNIKKKTFRRVYLFLISLIFIKKIRIRKYDNFKLKLDIRKYTQNHIYFKDYDKKVREFIKPLIKGDEIFIDIGAHIGFYSCFFSSLLTKGKVFAYEANKKNYTGLKSNIKLNNFKNIKCYNFGISSRNGNQRLVDTFEYNDGGNYVDNNEVIKDKKFKIVKFYKLDYLNLCLNASF